MADLIISDLSDICKNYDVIGIAEVAHGSLDSHEFQLELFKKLGIKNITIENLGPFATLLINAYLEGDLIVPTAHDIFKRMYFSGLGTLRYIEYAKENNIKINFIPTSYYFLHVSNETLELLSKLCSETFLSNISNDNFNTRLTNTDESIVKNKYDRYIYWHLMNRDAFMKKNKDKMVLTRVIKFWYHNISKALEKDNKLYIVGFHLQYNMPGSFGNMLRKNYNFISLGMASSYIEINFCSNVFDKKTFSMKKYNENKYKCEYKPLNYFDIYSKTKLEKDNDNSYNLIDTKLTKGFIHNFGLERMVIVKNKDKYLTYRQIYHEDNTTNINVFDYVIFIPESRFSYNMHL